MLRRPSAIAAIAVLLAGLLAWFAYSHHAKHVPRVGVLFPASAPNVAGGVLDQFREGLREAGYVEGKTILLDLYLDDGDRAKLTRQIEAWAQAPVDVIVAAGTGHVPVAQAVTKTIPIVFAVSVDPVKDGVVASLARPGSNATGLSIMNPELDGKRVARIKEALPALSRLGAVLDVNVERWRADLQSYEAAGKPLGVEIVPVPVRNLQEFEGAVQKAVDSGVQALLVETAPMFARDGKHLAQIALEKKLPVAFGFGDLAFAEGGTISYGASIGESWKRAANFVHRILQGAKPGDMPVEQPTRFVLIVNAKVAQGLGIALPQSLLVQADHVIR